MLLAMMLGATNMFAQDYDLQRLAEALNNYEFINFDVEFHDGLLKVYKNGKYGYINKKGELVIPCVYDEAGIFSEGWAYAIKYTSPDEEWGIPILTASFIDKTGKLVLESQYTIKSKARYKDGLIVVLNDNGQYGYMNRQGKLAIPCKYDDAEDFSEGFARVLMDGSYFFINKEGTIKSKQFKDDVSTFVCDGFIRYGGNYRDSYGGLSYGDGFYSINGNASIPLKYNGAGDFSEGLAFVSENNSSWKGFIDKNGKRALDFKYLVEDDKPKFKEGLVVVLNDNGKYGYMNRNGRMIVPCQFDEARNFSDGLAAVRDHEKLGFVDKYGNSTFNPTARTDIPQNTNKETFDAVEAKLSSVEAKGSVNDPVTKEQAIQFRETWEQAFKDLDAANKNIDNEAVYKNYLKKADESFIYLQSFRNSAQMFNPNVVQAYRIQICEALNSSKRITFDTEKELLSSEIRILWEKANNTIDKINGTESKDEKIKLIKEADSIYERILNTPNFEIFLSTDVVKSYRDALKQMLDILNQMK